VANTTIQIKRSLATAGPATLANGEVAYSSLTDKLYIGSPAGPVANVIAIGGRQFPGTLTANQALVANSLLGINQIQVANIVALGQITANNSALGSPGNVLLSGGTSGNVSARFGEGWIDRVHLPFTMYDNLLIKYAHATGGVLDSERGLDGIEKSYAKIAEEARNQYTLGYYTHQPVIDTRFRKIEVRLERSGMEVIAKTGYKTSAEDMH